VWGNYRLERVLGAGGMGIVYEAVHVGLNRAVAIKILKPEVAVDRQRLERFAAEARAAAQLSHPNLAAVHDVGEADGFHYFVMDLVAGEDLGTIIQGEGPLPVPRALQLAEEVARALEHAHQRGIVHRDIKPQNLLVGRDGIVKVTDFGISRVRGDARMTAAGSFMGTPEYLAPEQAMGGQSDGRSDVYSLGIVLFEMVTGQLPFNAETPIAVAMQQIHNTPPSPRALNPTLPQGVESLILRALAKGPEERFQSAGEFATAIARERAMPTQRVADSGQKGSEARPLPGRRPRPTPRGEDRRKQTSARSSASRVLVVVAIVPVLAGAGAMLWSLARNGARSTDPEPQAVLQIDSIPTGAEVVLDGTLMGPTPFRGEVRPGDYTIEIRQPGFNPWRGRIRIAGQGWRETIRLTQVAPIATPTQLPLPTAAPRPSPAATCDLAGERAILDGFLESWRTAWESFNLNHYMSFYDRSFYDPRKRMDYEQWKLHKQGLFQKYAVIRVAIYNVEILIDSSCDTASATFDQNYRSDRYQDHTRKQLRLRKIAGQWRIVEESELRKY
jgi:serine/threonine protein kinase